MEYFSLNKCNKWIKSGNSVILLGYIMALITGIAGSCLELVPGIDMSKAATMCRDSVVSGTTVFIDTDLASNTTLSSGTACTCTIDTQVGKRTEVISYYNGDSGRCSSETVFQFGDWTYSESNQCKLYENDFPTYSFTNMTVRLDKESSPADTRYCIRVALSKFVYYYSEDSSRVFMG